MPSLKDLLNRIANKHTLHAQVIFTALAFLAMVVFSYLFISGTVHNHLIENAEHVLTTAEAAIVSEMQEPQVTLSSFSRTIRSMLFRGDDLDMLQDYIDDMSFYLMSLTKDGHQISNFNGIFFCYDSIEGSPFINSMGWNPPASYSPFVREWYINAVEAQGDIAQFLSYPDVIAEGEAILIFSRCIHDDDDNHIGVVGLRIRMAEIENKVIHTNISHDGYGMLLSEDLKIIAHPNPDYIDRSVYDPEISISNLAETLEKNGFVSEYPMKTYKNEDAVAFFRKLSNGWYLGIITPKGPYYQTVTRMMFFLCILGFTLASVLIYFLVNIDMARKKSDSESRHKSAFLANMSHEMRTPMNAIVGMTSIGKNSKDTEKKDYCFSKIQDASNHLLGVISDILDMSKIEANKFDLSPVEFYFEKLLQRAVNVVNFRIEEKKQKFNVHIDPEIPKMLVADDQRLTQVVTNLLGNAIKFTPEGGIISLEARLLNIEENGCTIETSVSDTGIGITTEQQVKLFDSFEQAESSTTRKYGGTGLGLAISKSIVNLMNGEITVKSEPGKGSTFTFTIQCQYKQDDSNEGILSPDINWSNIRIMAVDDDPDILMYIKDITLGFGVSCDVAANGEEALKLVDTNGFYNINFVDWKMPGMDGIQLAAELKSRASENSVVIMISASEWVTIAEEAKRSGVDKFLSKPLFPSSIAEVINECLGKSNRHKGDTGSNISGIFKDRRVLLVEDVEINREIVITLLEPTQIQIDCAENGAEAVRIFSEAPPDRYDLILMDIQMPVMDGYTAARSIRALDHPRAELIRIIAMTANVFREDVEKCLEAGMDNHLGKPLDFGDVIKMLRIYLPRSAGREVK